jgi:hypothetical protein
MKPIFLIVNFFSGIKHIQLLQTKFAIKKWMSLIHMEKNTLKFYFIQEEKGFFYHGSIVSK